MQTATTYHPTAAIHWLKALPSLDGVLTLEGKSLDAYEANAVLDRLLLQGFIYMPTCDNCDETGSCKGHPHTFNEP